MVNVETLVNTDIVANKWDDFWKELPESVRSLPKRDVLIVSTHFLSGSNEEIQLQKILGAVQLTTQDYNLVSIAPEQQIAWHALREQLQPKTILLFGIDPAQLGVSIYFMPHQVNRFDERSWLPTISLSDLEQNADVKKHLWNYGMKPVFLEKAYG